MAMVTASNNNIIKDSVKLTFLFIVLVTLHTVDSTENVQIVKSTIVFIAFEA